MGKNSKSRQSGYYNERRVLDTAIKSADRKLNLVLSEEEDAEIWQKYRMVMCRYRKLELKYGHEERLNNSLWQREYYKPVFDDTYMDLTRQLRTLYAKKASQNTVEVREQIKQLLQLRHDTATFVRRDAEETKFEAMV